ncbi:hypothetical protein G5V58_22020 [Nocardioides anomalus]|uniref:Pyruvate/ketoisovalerate oxidoreductase catalytic domain-containing protein n=1 Tax=Nocardioides anomalus TaxID=2712223 RepID=A0A6G6WIL4_9ACTN|nr:2-oxoacid:acceptor oxidoreductase family protein [Nocardioides anomalus]QIG45084.1 hypothetical protein G5V58_22020 [Nocardioides anomalus]
MLNRAAPHAERTVTLTGIGGQGIQLVAKTLAEAFTRQGRYAMLGASYGGEMRGGPSAASVVVGDAPLRSLPVVVRSHAVLLFHDRFSEASLARLVPGGLCLVNSSVVGDDVVAELPGRRAVPATQTAKELGAAQAAGFVMLGAYCALVEPVPTALLEAALTDLLPPYRKQHAPTNARAVEAGHALGRALAPLEVAGVPA